MCCLWLCSVQEAKKHKPVISSYSDCCLQAFIVMPHSCCTCFPFCTSPGHSTGAPRLTCRIPGSKETKVLMQILQQEREVLEMPVNSAGLLLRHLKRCEEIKPHSSSSLPIIIITIMTSHQSLQVCLRCAGLTWRCASSLWHPALGEAVGQSVATAEPQSS